MRSSAQNRNCHASDTWIHRATLGPSISHGQGLSCVGTTHGGHPYAAQWLALSLLHRYIDSLGDTDLEREGREMSVMPPPPRSNNAHADPRTRGRVDAGGGGSIQGF